MARRDASDAIMQALGLCSDCQDRIRKHLTRRHLTLEDVVRGGIWDEVGSWPHGRGCPKVAGTETTPTSTGRGSTPKR